MCGGRGAGSLECTPRKTEPSGASPRESPHMLQAIGLRMQHYPDATSVSLTGQTLSGGTGVRPVAFVWLIFSF